MINIVEKGETIIKFSENPTHDLHGWNPGRIPEITLISPIWSGFPTLAPQQHGSLLTNLLWPLLWYMITLRMCVPLSSVRWGYRCYRSFIDWYWLIDTWLARQSGDQEKPTFNTTPNEVGAGVYGVTTSGCPAVIPSCRPSVRIFVITHERIHFTLHTQGL